MAQLRNICKRIVLIIITISILITFCATPASYAKLDLKDGDFYYAGTTKGSYVPKSNIFSWLLDHIGDIADWLLGIITMGFRMVFVGWTALIEKLLTWALESTTGMNVAGQAVDNMSSTDLTSITNSTNNVTVQAIVYNQVPALDINFFKLDYDKTVSGTGHKLHCQKCDKDVDECCTESTCCAECAGKCAACKQYMEALNSTEEPLVIQIKKIVASWYYIIRLLAAIALLVILIVIGIKMAISTIASDKAVYKRMLIDWIVGAIIVFSIHYIMLLVIYINESLVDVVRESANSVNKVSMMQLAEKSDSDIEYTDEEIEIDVYEAVRTRAYDAKLTIGLTGMIMYMTLVYFAIRYTLVYVKRYLTLIVLTLMGPAVGVSYAIQKALSGKSQSLKNWLTEYIMNVIIQTVHAIIYAVFISTALVLSLESISGIILALILMNYSLKAEKTFRQIFKMGSEGSLLDHTASAGDAEKIKQNMNTIQGLYMGAKPAAKAIMNTPYAKALKGAGKVGIAGGVALASKAKDRHEKNKFDRAFEKEMDKTGGVAFKRHADGRDAETEDAYEKRRQTAMDAVLGKNPDFSKFMPANKDTAKALINKGEKELKAELAVAASNLALNKPNAQAEYEKAMKNYASYKSLNLADTKEMVNGHAERLFDIENNFNFTKEKDKGSFTFNNIKEFKNGIFGTKHYDPKTDQMVSDGNGIYNQLSPKNLLGFTDDDKKVFKEQVLNPIKKGFGGMATMFVGMGTMVAHPTMGMALLGSGIALTRKTFKKPAKSKEYKGKYGFSKFSIPAMQTIQKEALARANREWNNAVVNNVKENHRDLYDAIGNDLAKEAKLGWKDNFVKDISASGKITATAATFGAVAGKFAIAPLATVGTAGFMAGKLVRHSGLAANLDAIDTHAAKQFKTQQLNFIQESLNTQGAVGSGEMSAKINKDEEKYKVEDQKDYYQLEMINLYKQQGIKYDPKTGTLTYENDSSSEKKIDTQKDEIVDKIGNRTISDNDNKTINKEIDIVIDKLIKSAGNNVIDMDSEAVQDQAINLLSARLEASGILEKNQNVEEVFKKGKNGLLDALKRKSDFSNNQIEVSNKLLENLKQEERDEIKKAVSELVSDKEDYSKVQVSDVLSKLNPTKDGSRKAKKEKDGSIKIDTSNPKYKEAIEDYIGSLQVIEKITPQNDIELKSKTSGAVKPSEKAKNRKRKLEQILTLNLENNPSVDEAIENVRNIKNKKVGAELKDSNHNKIDLNSSEVDNVLELLLMRKELEAINQYGSKELELKKGTAGYKEEVKRKSAKAVDYYGQQLRIETLKRDNYDEYIKYENVSREDVPESAKEIIEIKTLEKDLIKKKLIMENAEKVVRAKGPIIDINSEIKEKFK